MTHYDIFQYHFVTELTSMVVIKPNETTSSPLKETKDNRPSVEFGPVGLASSSRLGIASGFAGGAAGRGGGNLNRLSNGVESRFT